MYRKKNFVLDLSLERSAEFGILGLSLPYGLKVGGHDVREQVGAEVESDGVSTPQSVVLESWREPIWMLQWC